MKTFLFAFLLERFSVVVHCREDFSAQAVVDGEIDRVPMNRRVVGGSGQVAHEVAEHRDPGFHVVNPVVASALFILFIDR
jgi:hypothetical protein